MRLLIAVFVCLLSCSVFGQQFIVDVNEKFSMPEYLAIDQTGDLLNLTGILNDNFKRQGFTVVNPNWARHQLQKPKKKINPQEIALEVFRVLERSSAVDPSLNTIKRNKLINLARSAGVGSGLNEGINECVRQGSFVVLPKNIIAMSSSRQAPLVDVNIEKEWKAPIIYSFEFNYIYRDSFSCGKTISEFYASINDMSDGRKLGSMKFEQPTLSSMCKQEILNMCIRKLMAKNHHEFKFQISPNYIDLKSIAIIGKSGADCKGKKAASLANDFSSSILKIYNIVDRENLDVFFEEQHNSMSGLFEESDYIDAGRLAGAEGIVFVTATCINKHTEIDVSLSDTTTGSIQWSVHSENIGPHDIAERLIQSIINNQ